MKAIARPSPALWLAAAGFIMLAMHPAAASAGAVRGLQVCAGVIIPSLFPFLVAGRLLTLLGLPSLLGRAAGKLRLDGRALTPFILGVTGGYPAGAVSVAQLKESGVLSPGEAERLLPCCNNTGPAFIIGTAGAGIFGSGGIGALLYLCHVLAAVLLFPIFGVRRSGGGGGVRAEKPSPPADALTRSVSGALDATLAICGYVVFFSCLTALLEALGVFTAMSGAIAELTGAELAWARSLITGVLELGSGVSSMRGLAPTPVNLALCSFVLGFGGLAVHCQTLAAVKGADIKCARHFAGRCVHALISAVLTFLLSTLLGI